MRRFLEYSAYIIGVASLILSVYFYELSKKEREPTFIVEPVRTEIVNPELLKNSPIKIIAKDSAQITKNLTSVRFYFWNKGKESIRRDNVLRNIRISTPVGAKIIFYRILKTSREISDISLNQISEQELTIDFKILERDDGFTGELLVEGNPNTKIKVDGSIEGVSDFSNFPLTYYNVLGRALLYTIAVPLGLIVFFFMSGPSDTIRETKVQQLKKSTQYNEDEEFKKLVDKFENYQTASWKLNEEVDRRLNPNIDLLEKPRTKKTFRIALIIIVSIILIGGAIFSYYEVRAEINNSPINYIPKSIKP